MGQVGQDFGDGQGEALENPVDEAIHIPNASHRRWHARVELVGKVALHLRRDWE
jgi:hypothetical protein